MSTGEAVMKQLLTLSSPASKFSLQKNLIMRMGGGAAAYPTPLDPTLF
jgi:hypothetical protein